MTTRDYMARMPGPAIRIAYGSEAPEQFGELRVPAGDGPFPVVVVVHGGWWRSAYALTYAGHLAAAFTADGFASWNIEYRRVGNPGGGYPGTLYDVTAALGALREIARDYPLVQGVMLIYGFAFVLINLAVDLIYTFADPRVRYD